MKRYKDLLVISMLLAVSLVGALFMQACDRFGDGCIGSDGQVHLGSICP